MSSRTITFPHSSIPAWFPHGTEPWSPERFHRLREDCVERWGNRGKCFGTLKGWPFQARAVQMCTCEQKGSQVKITACIPPVRQEHKKEQGHFTYFAQTLASKLSCAMLTVSLASMVTSYLGKTGHRERWALAWRLLLASIMEEKATVTHHISPPWKGGLSGRHLYPRGSCRFPRRPRSSERVRAAEFCSWPFGWATVQFCCHWRPRTERIPSYGVSRAGQRGNMAKKMNIFRRSSMFFVELLIWWNLLYLLLSY